MSSWSRAFSCCFCARPQHNTKPHERTPLIAEGQIPTIHEPRVIDHQKMKERLGEIVRNKEGKMVNVNVQIPFNLHNQPIGVGGTASSSRSARRSLSGGANTSSSSMQNSRPASPSPSLLLTGSIASFEVEPRQPILNVRLVRGVSRGRSSRSKVRGGLGKHGEEGGREMHVDNGESPESEPTHVDGAAVEPDSLKPPRPLDDPPQWAGDQDPSGEAADDQSKTPQFTIQNVGVISRSWGD